MTPRSRSTLPFRSSLARASRVLASSPIPINLALGKPVEWWECGNRWLPFLNSGGRGRSRDQII